MTDVNEGVRNPNTPDGEESTGVAAAAESGDELQLLYAIRNKLASAIEDCPVRDLSPLTRRLQDTVKEIRELEERRAKERSSKEASSGGVSDKWDPSAEL
ncbi:terminase small subunit [Mycobacterium phage Dylan]|uniref:Terminase small subunit n=1 Tax=Mycobacterium phage Dylan TaxID=1340831 RepID=S5YZ31_9CAUD|nr:terminase small subunit [Mycobacterium phage Dylan]AGT20659.1 hypothetical protein PBI_DYLAN_29 [Mycobacterium phage Dylan]ALA48873.1 hypothetical protein ZAKHE101_30 [Mycobacterium phage Zakhe101]